jgi:phage terminase Nu1 subunit (DNA packaging protein)
MIDNTTLSTADLARLFGTTPKTVADLAKREIIVSAGKRGRWQLEPSVRGYISHLRAEAAGRGGETGADVRARLGAAQADLAAEKVKAMRGETLPKAEVEALWTSKLRAFRNRILAIPNRVSYLSLRQRESLTQELRAALTELADDKAV